MLAQLVAGMEKSDVAEYVNEADSNGITPLFLAKQKGAAHYDENTAIVIPLLCLEGDREPSMVPLRI